MWDYLRVRKQPKVAVWTRASNVIQPVGPWKSCCEFLAIVILQPNYQLGKHWCMFRQTNSYVKLDGWRVFLMYISVALLALINFFNGCIVGRHKQPFVLIHSNADLLCETGTVANKSKNMYHLFASYNGEPSSKVYTLYSLTVTLIISWGCPLILP